MKTVLVIDGQGGKIGGAIVEAILKQDWNHTLIVVGTNATATQTMMKAGAKFGATGENPVVVNASKADIIICPIGLLVANAMFGEVTPKMQAAVMDSPAEKIVIPFSQCGNFHFMTENLSINKLIQLSMDKLISLLECE